MEAAQITLSKNKRKSALYNHLSELESQGISLCKDTASVYKWSILYDDDCLEIYIAVAKSGSRKGQLGLLLSSTYFNGDGIFLTFIKGKGIHKKVKKVKEFYFLSEALFDEKSQNEFSRINDRISEEIDNSKVKSYFLILKELYLRRKFIDNDFSFCYLNDINSKKKKYRKGNIILSKKSNTIANFDCNLKEISKVESFFLAKIYRYVRTINRVIDKRMS